jgi:hypothetical protein
VDFDAEKPDWELDLLDALAGKRLEVKEGVDPTDPDLTWTAEIRTWGFGVFVRGRTKAAARWKLIEALALERLEKELRRMGWTEIERFIDEAEFVVARDPAGRRWGLGASDDDARKHEWIVGQIALEEGIDRAAVIDYRDIVDPARIQMTLDAAQS